MRRRIPTRAILTLIMVGSAIVALQLVWRFALALGDEWNDARLAPTFGLVNGVPLWLPYGEGPTLDAIYGPIGPLTWLPAALAASPTGAIAIAALLSLVLLLAPVIWIVWMEARRYVLLATATLVLGLALQLSTPALPVIGVHADVPALGYATLALACVWTARRRRTPAWVWTGALFVIAAAGAKQVMAPLLVLWPAWIAVTSGRRAAGQALVALTVLGVAALGAVVIAFDEAAMIDATILGPIRHPWIDSTRAALWIVAVELIQRSLPLLALLTVAGWQVHRRHPTWRHMVRGERWLFPLAVAAACVPTSLVGGAKVGGAANALSFTIWFVWLALLAAVASAGRRGVRARATFTAASALIACALALRLVPDLAGLPELLQRSPAASVAFAAARAAPNTIYFPYRPLIGMMADGRADHLDPGLYFRELEGRRVDEAFVRAYLPPALNRVAADRQMMPHSLNHLPSYRRQILDPSLPGWIVMTESDLLLNGDQPAPVTTEGELPAALPATPIAAPDQGVDVSDVQVTVPDRSRRPIVRLEARLQTTAPLDVVVFEVVLRDRERRQVVTLVAARPPAPDGRVAAEWPVFSDLLRSAKDAVVIVREGQPSSATGLASWRLSAQDLRPLVHAVAAASAPRQ